MTPEQTSAYFSDLYANADDPFGYTSRWYEARKRALLLAGLPERRYRRGWEIGCSNGETTARLSARCDSLLATDLDARAVALAAKRNAALANVRVVQARHPDDWPSTPDTFDLIVISEVGYYLAPPEMSALAIGIGERLDSDGVIVACHWRAPFSEAAQSADAVHRTLGEVDGLVPVLSYSDGDLLMDAWSRDARSVGQREGLR